MSRLTLPTAPTTRHKACRESVANQVLLIASIYGAVGEIFRRHGDHPREIHARIDDGRVRVQFTINSQVQAPNVFVLPWVSNRAMSPQYMAEVNPVHCMKATHVYGSIGELISSIDSVLSRSKSGALFLSYEKVAP